MAASLTNAERETVLTMTADDRGTWHVGTDDPVWVRRLEAVGAGVVCERGEWREYRLEAKQVTVRKQLSPEERERRAAVMRRVREAGHANR